MNVRIAFVALCGYVLASAAHASVTITDVRPDRTRFDPSRHEVVAISFSLSEPASTVLHVYDGRGIEIRHIESQGELSAGEHDLRWDGRDWRGKDVPAEAYAYTLSAKGPDGQLVAYDLTDVTGGDELVPRDVKWDAATGRVSYVLDKPARVNIRLGLQNDGPLLRTLIDWVPRTDGLQSEAWDGFDASRMLNLAAHPSLVVAVSAFSVPDNTIFVGGSPTTVRVIEELPDPLVRRPAAVRVKHMYDHSQQPLESRGDYMIQLQLPRDLRTRGGLPVIEGPTPLTIESESKDRARVISRRFEPVYFVDGQFLFENETGFLPMTWVWDPATTSEGIHYLTVNLRGYEGNFGMATRKVYVRHPDSKK
jgi:FlgD Ig-like domain